MAKQHVCCWRVSGPMADIAKSTRLTLTGHRPDPCSHIGQWGMSCSARRIGTTFTKADLMPAAWSAVPANLASQSFTSHALRRHDAADLLASLPSCVRRGCKRVAGSAIDAGVLVRWPNFRRPPEQCARRLQRRRRPAAGREGLSRASVDGCVRRGQLDRRRLVGPQRMGVRIRRVTRL